MNTVPTVKKLLNDCKNFLRLTFFLLIGDGLLSFILLLVLHAWEAEAALYLFRGVYLATGALGLLVGAILLISGRFQQKVVQDQRFAVHFHCFPFLVVLLGCSTILILAGALLDFAVRGL